MPGKAIVAATEAMLTIEPPLPAAPSGRIARNACLMPRAVPSTLTSSIVDTAGLEIDQEGGDLDAGVVDQDVEAAELVDGRGDRGLPRRLVGDVEPGGSGLAPALGDRGGRRGAELLLQVADHHRGTRCRQGPGHALAEALRPTRHQGRRGR